MARSYPVRNAIIQLLTNNNLFSILTNQGTLTPTFSPAITEYTIDFGNEVTTINFMTEPQEKGALVEIDGKQLAINQISETYFLDEGANTFTFVVTAEDGTTKRYNITVNRFPTLDNLILNDQLSISGDLSLSIWIKLDAINVDRYAISKYGVFQIDANRTFTNTPRVTLTFDDASTVTLAATGFTNTAGQWVHLACTHDSATGTTKIFVNGTLINSVTNIDKIGVNLKQNSEVIWIGGKKFEAAASNNNVRDARVYNIVLLDTQITSIYNLQLLTTTITSISPTSGLIGDTITIEGSNFLQATVVSIGGVSATVIYINSYRITAIIPTLTEGSHVVYVTTDSVILSNNYFEVIIPPLVPSISKITPSGYAGETVTITGNNFSNISGRNQVFFNDGVLSATIVTETNTVITCLIPDGVEIGYIKVINDYNESTLSPYEFLSLQANTPITSLLDAANDGDTINLPAGAYVFTTQYSMSNKNINLVGHQDGTWLVNRFTNSGNYILKFITKNTGSFRITNLNFQSGFNTNVGGYLSVEGDNPAFRLDHCYIYNAYNPVRIQGLTYGVIDHNYFYNAGGSNIHVLSEVSGDGGTYAWDHPRTVGDANALYIEDNIFIGTTDLLSCPADGFCGMSLVFRYNDVSTKLNYPLISVHGSYGYGRGTYSLEVYENIFTGAGVSCYWGIYPRGGRGVIFNNTLLGNVSLPVALGEYRVFKTKANLAAEYPTQIPNPNWTDDAAEVDYIAAHPEIAGTSIDYCDLVYPSPDQINNMYIWNNTYKGVPAVVTVRDMGNQRLYIQENRDYFLNEMPGYTPYTYPHPLIT